MKLYDTCSLLLAIDRLKECDEKFALSSITLEEIENWQCCGGVFTTARDEVATKLSSVRLLKAAGFNTLKLD